jgi:hypothetical protein
LTDRSQQAASHEGPPEIFPPVVAVDRLRRKQMKSEIASRENSGLDTTQGADQDWLYSRGMLHECVRDGQGWHQMSARAAACDKDGMAVWWYGSRRH